MENSTIWWLVAGIFVVLELATGTFYLLMLALGMAAGALCAHLGLAVNTQIVIAALIGVIAVLVWHKNHPAAAQDTVTQNQAIHLDIGSAVQVTKWISPQATRVMHRGADWSARLIQKDLPEDADPEIGTYRIVAVDGNTLVLSKI